MPLPRSTGRRPSTLHVTVVGRSGGRAAAGLAAWLKGAAPSGKAAELTIALVGDRQMRVLNRTFRQKDSATDVLSFPSSARDPRTGQTDQRLGTQDEGPFLGDIVIAVGVAKRQAGEFGHSLSTELRILALHGLLHLLGYDHERDGGAMRRAEDRLRRKAGLPAGLIARAPARRRSR